MLLFAVFVCLQDGDVINWMIHFMQRLPECVLPAEADIVEEARAHTHAHRARVHTYTHMRARMHTEHVCTLIHTCAHACTQVQHIISAKSDAELEGHTTTQAKKKKRNIENKRKERHRALVRVLRV